MKLKQDQHAEMDDIDSQSSDLADITLYFACLYCDMTWSVPNRQVLARHGSHGLVMVRKQPLRVPGSGTRSGTYRKLTRSPDSPAHNRYGTSARDT